MGKIIILFASSRRRGNTGKLAGQIAEELGIEVIDLGSKDISPFDYEHRNRNDDFESIMDRVLNADKIVFASPIYWYAVAPAMKTFIDRISDYLSIPELLNKGRELRGKTAYVICTSEYDEPSEPFINAFKNTFYYLGIKFGGYVNANCKNGFKFDEHEGEISAFITRVQTFPGKVSS